MNWGFVAKELGSHGAGKFNHHQLTGFSKHVSEVKFMQHEINHLKVSNSWYLVCSQLYSQQLYLVPKHFYHPRREPWIHEAQVVHQGPEDLANVFLSNDA